MYNKFLQFTILMLLVFTALTFAQNLEYYRPVGFQNPLLKSGQYIMSAYYHYENQESERDVNLSETNRYNLATSGYLGVTDKMTLSTNFNFFPRQTTFQEHGETKAQNYENLNLQTEVTLSYRPRQNLEFWGTAYYTSRKTNYGERTSWGTAYVGEDPETGAIRYEEKEIVQPGQHPLKTTNSHFRVGFTLTGNAW